MLGKDVELKGGWGPDPDGRHLVRQMGIAGPLAVALAAIPADGSFESGTTCSIAWRSGSASRKGRRLAAAWPKRDRISAARRISGSSGSGP